MLSRKHSVVFLTPYFIPALLALYLPVSIFVCIFLYPYLRFMHNLQRFDPYGRYGRFYGVTDRSNRAVTVTGVPFWTRSVIQLDQL